MVDERRQREEDWLLNKVDIDNLTEITERILRNISQCKYISVSSKNFDVFFDRIELLLNNNVSLANKKVVINITEGFYLTKEQCDKLEKVEERINNAGAKLKIKDGKYWDIKEVAVVSSNLDKVVNKIKNATVEENGVSRPLNEFEKFLWAYSYVANRKYRENEADTATARSITSIIRDGDCVCVGFSTLLKELCEKLGIECYRNSCNIYNKETKQEFGHANNVVVINGIARYCDACFDCLTNNKRRTFCHCLTSFEDRKDSLAVTASDATAPFCDIDEDLEDIKTKLQKIKSTKDFSYEDYAKYTDHKNKVERYLALVPKYENTVVRNYKEQCIYYYTEVIKLIELRRIKQPIRLEEFEKSLINVYMANGYAREKAQEEARLDIEASIAESGLSYTTSATNCFATAYYNQLEV